MLQLKLFHSKTATKYVKGAKMAEFIKTCDQYAHKFSCKDGGIYQNLWLVRSQV